MFDECESKIYAIYIILLNIWIYLAGVSFGQELVQGSKPLPQCYRLSLIRQYRCNDNQDDLLDI